MRFVERGQRPARPSECTQAASVAGNDPANPVAEPAQVLRVPACRRADQLPWNDGRVSARGSVAIAPVVTAPVVVGLAALVWGFAAWKKLRKSQN